MVRSSVLSSRRLLATIWAVEDDGDGSDGGAGLEVVEGVAVLQPLTKTMVTSMRSHRSARMRAGFERLVRSRCGWRTSQTFPGEPYMVSSLLRSLFAGRTIVP